MFGSPEVSYQQTYSARDWLSIMRTAYPTQNLQKKHAVVTLETERIKRSNPWCLWWWWWWWLRGKEKHLLLSLFPSSTFSFFLVMVGYKQGTASGSEEGRMMGIGLLGVRSRAKELNIWAHFVFGVQRGVKFWWLWDGCIWVEILKLIFGGLHETRAV